MTLHSFYLKNVHLSSQLEVHNFFVVYSFNQLSACVKIMPVMDSHRSLKAICHFHFFCFVMLISSEIIFTSRKDIVSDD